MSGEFIRIPIEKIRKDKCGKTLTKDQFSLDLLTFAYIEARTMLSPVVLVTIEDILRESGLTTRSRSIKDTVRYKALLDILKRYQDEEYIQPIEKLGSLSAAKPFHIAIDLVPLTVDSYGGKEVITSPFVMLDSNEYQALITCNEPSNRLVDLHVYLYIKSFIWKRFGERLNNPQENPEYACLSQVQIAEGSWLSIPTVQKSISRLTGELDLLYAEPAGSAVDNLTNEIYSFPTIYVIKDGNYKQEPAWGRERYKNMRDAHFKSKNIGA